MDPQETKTLLEQAASLIREGEKKSARLLLLQILRVDEGVAQAWYMLSFTVPDSEKQISALQQALRLKPNSQKIIDRLTALGGTPAPELAADDLPAKPPASKVSPKIKPEPPVPPAPSVSDEELLTRRLFGGGDEEEYPSTDPTKKSEDEPEPVIDPVDVVRSADSAEGQPKEKIDFPTEEAPAPKKRHRKVFGIRRNYFLLGILILIFLCLWLLGAITDQDGLLPLSGNLQPTATELAAAQSAAPTSTTSPTDEPAPIPPEPTQTPTPTQPLFSLAGLQPPSSDMLPLIAQYQDEIQTLIGSSSTTDFQTFFVSEQNLQALIRDFSKLPHFEEQVSAASDFYQMLDLANGSENFVTFYQNYWADPNGTLLIPNKNTVAVVGFDFSDYQHYSFGQAYIQHLRQEQSALSSFFDPAIPCYLPTEECLIQSAVIKGEAAFSASQWTNQYFDAENLARIASSTLKYHFVPIIPAPSDLMSLLAETPYLTGFALSEAVYNQGGWAKLEELYLDPPATTEQLLHPEKFLSGELPEPVNFTDLSSILSEDWSIRYQGILGEWNTTLLLAYNQTPITRLPEEQAKEAAAGWNGDYAQAFLNPAGEQILVIHWNWDLPQDADEFYLALTDYSIGQTSSNTVELAGQTCHMNDGLTSCPIITGKETIWILAPSSETAELVLENYEALKNTP